MSSSSSSSSSSSTPLSTKLKDNDDETMTTKTVDDADHGVGNNVVEVEVEDEGETESIVVNDDEMQTEMRKVESLPPSPSSSSLSLSSCNAAAGECGSNGVQSHWSGGVKQTNEVEVEVEEEKEEEEKISKDDNDRCVDDVQKSVVDTGMATCSASVLSPATADSASEVEVMVKVEDAVQAAAMVKTSPFLMRKSMMPTMSSEDEEEDEGVQGAEAVIENDNGEAKEEILDSGTAAASDSVSTFTACQDSSTNSPKRTAPIAKNSLSLVDGANTRAGVTFSAQNHGNGDNREESGNNSRAPSPVEQHQPTTLPSPVPSPSPPSCLRLSSPSPPPGVALVSSSSSSTSSSFSVSRSVPAAASYSSSAMLVQSLSEVTNKAKNTGGGRRRLRAGNKAPPLPTLATSPRRPLSHFLLCCVKEDGADFVQDAATAVVVVGGGGADRYRHDHYRTVDGSDNGTDNGSECESETDRGQRTAPPIKARTESARVRSRISACHYIHPIMPQSCRACVVSWTERTRERFERNIESLLSTTDCRGDGGGGGGGGYDGPPSFASAAGSLSETFEERYRNLVDRGLSDLEQEEQKDEADRAVEEAMLGGGDLVVVGGRGHCDKDDDVDDNDVSGGGDIGDDLPRLPLYRRSLANFPRNRESRLKWIRRKITMSPSPQTNGLGDGGGLGGNGRDCLAAVGNSSLAGEKVAADGRRRSGLMPPLSSTHQQSPSSPVDSVPSVRLIRNAQSFDDHILRNHRMRQRGLLFHPTLNANTSTSAPTAVSSLADRAASCHPALVLSGDNDCMRLSSGGGGGSDGGRAGRIRRQDGGGQGISGRGRIREGGGRGGGSFGGGISRALHLVSCECGGSNQWSVFGKDDVGGSGGGGGGGGDRHYGGGNGDGAAARHFSDRSLLESDEEDGGYDSDPESFVGTHRYSADVLKAMTPSVQEEKNMQCGDDDADSDTDGGEEADDGGNGAKEAHFAERGRPANPAGEGNKENELFDIMGDSEKMDQLVEEVMHTAMTLIWHPSNESTKNPNGEQALNTFSSSVSATNSKIQQKPTCVKAWIELGCRVKGQIIQPKLVWRNAYQEPHGAPSSFSGGCSPGPTDARRSGMAAVGMSTETLRTVDVLDIARILTHPEIDRGRYPLAKTSKSFTIVTTNGTVYLFEVSDATERDRLVSGLKLLVARLASLIIVGDKRLFDDFFYPTTSADFQRKFFGDGNGIRYLGG